MSIPFDGRWRNGEHFRADFVLDGRTRPDPSTTGLVSWKQHETQYQLDLVHSQFGCPQGSALVSTSFYFPPTFRQERRFYFGVGYKKDQAGFWARKHWGNENFGRLARMLAEDHPENEVVMTGDAADLQMSIGPILRIAAHPRVVGYAHGGLRQSFDVLASCSRYFGNDTGMMHVAASMGLKTVAVFRLENSIVKSRPWAVPAELGHVVLDGTSRDISPEEAFQCLTQ
jgi:ADP-heptose:LPS heptosyltransferase